MAVRRPLFQVDERTDEITDTALMCRTFNHAWIPVPQGARRRATLLKLGQIEAVRRCSRCGAARTDQIDLDSWSVVGSRMEYPEGYLMKGAAGSGRLPRSSARQALFLRGDRIVV